MPINLRSLGNKLQLFAHYITSAPSQGLGPKVNGLGLTWHVVLSVTPQTILCMPSTQTFNSIVIKVGGGVRPSWVWGGGAQFISLCQNVTVLKSHLFSLHCRGSGDVIANFPNNFTENCRFGFYFFAISLHIIDFHSNGWSRFPEKLGKMENIRPLHILISREKWKVRDNVELL